MVEFCYFVGPIELKLKKRFSFSDAQNLLERVK